MQKNYPGTPFIPITSNYQSYKSCDNTSDLADWKQIRQPQSPFLIKSDASLLRFHASTVIFSCIQVGDAWRWLESLAIDISMLRLAERSSFVEDIHWWEADRKNAHGSGMQMASGLSTPSMSIGGSWLYIHREFEKGLQCWTSWSESVRRVRVGGADSVNDFWQTAQFSHGTMRKSRRSLDFQSKGRWIRDFPARTIWNSYLILCVQETFFRCLAVRVEFRKAPSFLFDMIWVFPLWDCYLEFLAVMH